MPGIRLFEIAYISVVCLLKIKMLVTRIVPKAQMPYNILADNWAITNPPSSAEKGISPIDNTLITDDTFPNIARSIRFAITTFNGTLIATFDNPNPNIDIIMIIRTVLTGIIP